MPIVNDVDQAEQMVQEGARSSADIWSELVQKIQDGSSASMIKSSLEEALTCYGPRCFWSQDSSLLGLVVLKYYEQRAGWDEGDEGDEGGEFKALLDWLIELHKSCPDLYWDAIINTATMVLSCRAESLGEEQMLAIIGPLLENHPKALIFVPMLLLAAETGFKRVFNVVLAACPPGSINVYQNEAGQTLLDCCLKQASDQKCSKDMIRHLRLAGAQTSQELWFKELYFWLVEKPTDRDGNEDLYKACLLLEPKFNSDDGSIEVSADLSADAVALGLIYEHLKCRYMGEAPFFFARIFNTCNLPFLQRVLACLKEHSFPEKLKRELESEGLLISCLNKGLSRLKDAPEVLKKVLQDDLAEMIQCLILTGCISIKQQQEFLQFFQKRNQKDPVFRQIYYLLWNTKLDRVGNRVMNSSRRWGLAAVGAALLGVGVTLLFIFRVEGLGPLQILFDPVFKLGEAAFPGWSLLVVGLGLLMVSASAYSYVQRRQAVVESWAQQDLARKTAKNCQPSLPVLVRGFHAGFREGPHPEAPRKDTELELLFDRAGKTPTTADVQKISELLASFPSLAQRDKDAILAAAVCMRTNPQIKSKSLWTLCMRINPQIKSKSLWTLLVCNGADVNQVSTDPWESLLYRNVEKLSLTEIQELVDLGADVEAPSRNQGGETALIKLQNLLGSYKKNDEKKKELQKKINYLRSKKSCSTRCAIL